MSNWLRAAHAFVCLILAESGSSLLIHKEAADVPDCCSPALSIKVQSKLHVKGLAGRDHCNGSTVQSMRWQLAMH